MSYNDLHALYVFTASFFTPEQCQKALELFSNVGPRTSIDRETMIAEVLTVEGRPVETGELRRGRASFLLPRLYQPGTPEEKDMRARNLEAASLYNAILEKMCRCNNSLQRAELVKLEPLQLAVYEEGDFYDWHQDLGHGDAANRKLSATIQLSPADAYEGGELELWGAAGRHQVADRTQGTITMFPSYMLHRVRPVTRGVRRSLVAWAIGSRPFR